MKTELDKCMAGEWYDCHDPIFITQKGKTRQLLARYNALPYEEKKTKQEVLKEMFGSIGKGSYPDSYPPARLRRFQSRISSHLPVFP